MCFLYELHEYIELFKTKNYDNFNNHILNNIDNIEDNIIELYYKNNNKNDINEKINSIIMSNISNIDKNKYTFFEELLYNILNIFNININKKRDYYTYIYNIKNVELRRIAIIRNKLKGGVRFLINTLLFLVLKINRFIILVSLYIQPNRKLAAFISNRIES